MNDSQAVRARHQSPSRPFALQSELDMLARVNGYVSYAAMYKSIMDQKRALPVRARRRLLKELVPLSRSAADRGDLVGLPALQDLAASVARMIRVLLLGYTPNETAYLQSGVARVSALSEDGPQEVTAGREVLPFGRKSRP